MEEYIMAEQLTNQDILKALLDAPKEVKKNVPMKRFGIDFVLRALEPDEADKIKQRATRLIGKGKKHFDEDLFNYLSIAKTCVVPNWEDPQLLEALGVHDSVAAIKKQLLFGEVAQLLIEIAELNGLDKSEDEQIEDAKN